MHTEPAIMQNDDRNPNAPMPDRLYGEHYPDSFLDVPRPVRESNVSTLGDYIRHLQEINQQPDQSCVACVSPESNFDHICPNNPILTCNCTDPKFCAELGSNPDNIVDGNKRCPDSGLICNDRVCPDECLGDKDGFADNIDYTGIPYPSTKGKDAVSGWPCVVVGAICETWTTATERILRTTASGWDTEQHTDAGLNNDGPAATKGL
jgi:hypothetical protein